MLVLDDVDGRLMADESDAAYLPSMEMNKHNMMIFVFLIPWDLHLDMFVSIKGVPC